jgi:hypothetical protein
MSKWAESRYEGETLDGWYHGKGKYFFANGSVYQGDFYKGEFHGEGTIIYPGGVTVMNHFRANIRPSGRRAK